MPNESYSGRARCPFYLSCRPRDRGDKIVCEGLRDGMKIALTFRNTTTLDEYFDECCAAKYETCAIFRAVMKEKYGDES